MTPEGSNTRTRAWPQRSFKNASDTITKRYFTQGVQLGGTNYYYTRDHLGSIRELTGATGAVQASYTYDPYGQQTQLSGTMAADFGYTGDYSHQPSALCLTQYRQYSALLGRWLSRDPSGEGSGINLYDYVQGNPTNSIDPLGLCTCAEEVAERDKIITEAVAFNKHTVWSWVNQCAEQASALISDLLAKGLNKCWNFQTIGGSTKPFIINKYGIKFGYGIQEHAVEATPHKTSDCCRYGPFIMDPYHGPGTNSDRNVLIETPDQFNAEYPYPID